MGEDCRCHTTTPMAGDGVESHGRREDVWRSLEVSLANYSDTGLPKMLFVMPVSNAEGLSMNSHDEDIIVIMEKS